MLIINFLKKMKFPSEFIGAYKHYYFFILTIYQNICNRVRSMNHSGWLLMVAAVISHIITPLGVTMGSIFHDSLPLMGDIIEKLNMSVKILSTDFLSSHTQDLLQKSIPGIDWDHQNTKEKWQSIKLLLDEKSTLLHRTIQQVCMDVYGLTHPEFESSFTRGTNSLYKWKANVIFNSSIAHWQKNIFLPENIDPIVLSIRNVAETPKDVQADLQLITANMDNSVEPLRRLAHKAAVEFKDDNNNLPDYLVLSNSTGSGDRPLYQDTGRSHKEVLFCAGCVLIIGQIINRYLI